MTVVRAHVHIDSLVHPRDGVRRLPLVRPGGLIVAHNINRQQADPAYVKAITTNPALETVFLNLGTSGISVTMKKR